MNFGASAIHDAMELLRTMLFREGVTFDQRQGERIAFLNGEVALMDGRWVMTPHCRESWLTSTVPHKWDAGATCPLFDTYLAGVFAGDKDAEAKALLIFEMIGASLMPTCRFERGLILFGPKGRNGKSTLLRVIEAVLGSQNVSSIPVGKLGDRFNLIELRGKLANIVAEVGVREGLPEDIVKKITSGDAIQGEFKGRDPVTFRPYAKLWIGANVMPSQRDFTPALLRRFSVVGFNRQFKPGAGEDKDLACKLIAEA